MLYSQLTEGERNQIYALLQEDVSQYRIAVILRKDTSMISREEIAFVMERLNHRQQKMLDFKPPYDVFVKSESNGFARVALGS